MTALGWITTTEQRLLATCVGRSRSRPRTRSRRSTRLSPGVEGLEPIALLAVTCPTISGFVFVDENPTNPALTNNGLFDPGESPIPGAQVQLLDSSNRLVAVTTSAADGSYSFGGMSTDAETPVTITQTLSIGNLAQPNIPTNFTDLAFVPPLQLFNPSLGTLQSVQISSDVVYDSSITITNLSQITPATGITAMLSGTGYDISGLGPDLTISGTPMKSATGTDLPAWNGKPGQEPSETIDLSVDDKQHPILSALQDLAFFTARSGQSTTIPPMTAIGGGTASANNGNGQVSQSTFVAAQLIVTYTYIPAAECLINPGSYTIEQIPTPPNLIDGKASENGVVFPSPGSPQKLNVTIATTTDNLINNDFGKLTAANPTPGPIVRIGVHHQKTQLIVPFKGAVNPVIATDPKNYTVIVSPTLHVPIVSAKFSAITNAVTLVTARRLNFRDRYVLSFYLPGFSSQKTLVNIPFGGKDSLVGFQSKNRKRFIPVKHGHIVH
jgi:SdrD B-like domain